MQSQLWQFVVYNSSRDWQWEASKSLAMSNKNFALISSLSLSSTTTVNNLANVPSRAWLHRKQLIAYKFSLRPLPFARFSLLCSPFKDSSIKAATTQSRRIGKGFALRDASRESFSFSKSEHLKSQRLSDGKDLEEWNGSEAFSWESRV